VIASLFYSVGDQSTIETLNSEWENTQLAVASGYTPMLTT
jgi:hypothetical protein